MCGFLPLLLIILVQLLGYKTIAATKNDCSTDADCLKCGNAGCIKCLDFLTYPGRKCVLKCPHGYRAQWSTYADYMGKICVHRGSFLGLSNESLTILTGVLSGTICCVIIISIAAIYVHRKRKALISQSGTETASEVDDTPERKEFLKQLEVLKPYAGNFLDILNDTRRQLRESHNDGDNSAAAVYKPIVRDLAKILLILNRSSDSMAIPDDWEHLFNWAEKTLKRCKRMSDVSQPQVAQLISFLQSPIEPETMIRPTMSTFKPDCNDSNSSLQEIAVKSFTENYENNLNPQWKFNYTLINNYPSSQFDPAAWTNSKENLSSPTYFLDDDFCLGFRPQDEITTEL